MVKSLFEPRAIGRRPYSDAMADAFLHWYDRYGDVEWAEANARDMQRCHDEVIASGSYTIGGDRKSFIMGKPLFEGHGVVEGTLLLYRGQRAVGTARFDVRS